jgi:hypothetical protein
MYKPNPEHLELAALNREVIKQHNQIIKLEEETVILYNALQHLLDFAVEQGFNGKYVDKAAAVCQKVKDN